MNLLLTFTNTVSLREWDKIGILDREVLLYKKLSQKGISVTFLTYGDKSDLLYSNSLKDINIIPIKDKTELKTLPFIRTILFPPFNYKIFKNIDIIKTNQMGGSWITWLLKIIYRKKIILRCGYETYKNELYEYRKLAKHKRALMRLLFLYITEWISYVLANHIIVSNNFDKNFIINTFKMNFNKISIIPNIIDTKVFDRIPTEKKAKSVLFIGRLDEAKNLENLIESFKYLEDYTLDIVGKGHLEPLLRSLVEKSKLQSNINFLGNLHNSEIPKLINQYHVFILPSHWEGNPKTLLEAMSCGIACIGSNTPGIKEIIKHKKNGYLCNFDSESIANAIRRVYEDTELRKKLGYNARNYIMKNNSCNTIVERETKIYQSLLKPKKMFQNT